MTMGVPRPRCEPADPASPVTALLLHGMGANARSWDSLAPLLSTGFQPWDVTLPWSLGGDPEWARDPDVTQWVARPIEFLRKVTGRAPHVVVAHSFAANVVLEVMASGGLPADTAVVLLSAFYRADGRELDWVSVIPGMKECYAKVAELRRGSAMSQQVCDAVVRRLLESMGDHAPLRFYEVCRRTPSLALDSLTQSVLLVGGENDGLGAHADGLRALGQRIPHARVEILHDCGHFPMTERPDAVAALLATLAEEVTH